MRTLALLLLFSTFAAAQDVEVVRDYDVRALHAVGLQTEFGSDRRVEGGVMRLDALELGSLPLEERTSFDVDWEHLLAALVPDADCEEYGGFVRITATPELHERVAAILRHLEADAGRRVRVVAAPLPDSTALPAKAVLDRREVDDLLERVEASDLLVGATYPGAFLRLGTVTREALLYEYDIEMTNLELGLDPRITLVEEGARVNVVADVHDDGEWFLRVWGTACRPAGPIGPVPSGPLGRTEVQLGAWRTAGIWGSAVVPDGGGIVLGHHELPYGAWLITVARSRWAESKVVHMGAAVADPFTCRAQWLPGPDPSGGLYPHEFELPSDFHEAPFTDQGDLEDVLIREAVHPMNWRVFTTGVHHADLVAAVRATEVLRGPTVSLELRMGQVDGATARQLARGELRAPWLEALTTRVLGSARSGDSLHLSAIQKRMYAHDYDIELGGGVTGPDPTTGMLLTGFSFMARPVVGAGGDVHLWCELEVAHDLGETVLPVVTNPRMEEQLTPKDSDRPQTLQLPRVSCASARRALVARSGEPALLHCGPLEGRDGVLVAVVVPTIVR